MKTIHSIYYHNPKPEQFERLLIRYLKKGFRFISIEDLYALLIEQKPVHEKLCFISLDDGWRSNLELLPVIEKYHIPFCVFVATEPLLSGNYWWEFITEQRGFREMVKFKELSFNAFNKQLEQAKKQIHLNRSSMTEEDVRCLAKHSLISIQSHTVNHPILTSVPDDVLEKELSQSKIILEGLIDKEVFAFSYPNGSLSVREINAVKKEYKLAFTTEMRHISINDNLFLLPRVALTGNYYRDLLKIYGIWPIVKKIVGLFK